jgi:hypothetical protein
VSAFTLRLIGDRLAAGAAGPVLPSGANRMLYVVSGQTQLVQRDAALSLAPGSAWHGKGEAQCRAGAEGVEILRYELIAGDATDAGSEVKLSRRINLDAGPHLMRCDRVDMKPGSVRELHCHICPGIRCLIAGAFRLRRNGKSDAEERYAPGQAWFEDREDPVVALGSESAETSFIRVLVAPRDYLGRRTSRTLGPGGDLPQPPLLGGVFLDLPIDA